MASVKLDQLGLYPMNHLGDVVAWVTPEDVVQGLIALASEKRAEGDISNADRLKFSADKMAATAWYSGFLSYQNQVMRQPDETCNIY